MKIKIVGTVFCCIVDQYCYTILLLYNVNYTGYVLLTCLTMCTVQTWGDLTGACLFS